MRFWTNQWHAKRGCGDMEFKIIFVYFISYQQNGYESDLFETFRSHEQHINVKIAYMRVYNSTVYVK